MDKNEQVMSAFWNLFNKKIWLDGCKLKEKLKDFNPSEIHCIEYIQMYDDANVTKLADSFYMTRSAISKLTKRLMKKGLIESYQKPDNKKEIYFKLTKQGKHIYDIHETLHDEFQMRDQCVFEQFHDDEINNMLKFAEVYNQHLEDEIQKLGVDLKNESYDKF